MRGRRLGILVAAVALVAGGATAARAVLDPESCVRDAGGPNVLLILTDDQPWDTLWAMPHVQRLLVRQGITFSNAVVSDPLCCPSRATVLTGQHAHRHEVWQNRPPFGGFPVFRDRSTVATWLQSAGLRTALFGKYLNAYEGTYVPPGWDRWGAIGAMASPHDLYYRYGLNQDGRLEVHGGYPEDYSTTVLAEQAAAFVCGTDGPLFLSFNPFAPHSPYWPAPGDRYDGPLPPPGPAFDEADVSDKPAWVRALPRLGPERRAEIDRWRRGAIGTLAAVDRAVGDLVGALEETGRLQDTLVVFTSDNGFAWGEHRWVDKIAPYEESIRVPLVVRYDRMIREPGTVDGRLVTNADLAPTFAELVGAAAPGAEGRSFLPLLTSGDHPWPAEVPIEGMELFGVPSYCGVRTAGAKYVAYATGEEEYYDLRADPAELSNLADAPAARAEVERLRGRAVELCEPPPPGFAWPPGLTRRGT